MTQCIDANFHEIVIGQIGQDINLNGIFLETGRVLAELKAI
jgi:hypothetical protein